MIAKLRETIARKTRVVSTFAFLSSSDREYLRLIKKHNAVDRRHYRGVHHRVNSLFLLWPERHYVAFGESLGLSPNPRFVPFAYARNNLGAVPAGARPLEHYLLIGKRQELPCQDMVTDTDFPVVTPTSASANVAVVVHLYFLDMWHEIAAELGKADIDFDLFVTLTDQPEAADATRSCIQADFPASRVFVIPNHGRDIYPFLLVLGSGALDSYEFVCKLHGKKSLHRTDGGVWRRRLVEGLLQDGRIAELLDAFAQDQSQVVTASSSLRSDPGAWSSNRANVERLLGADTVEPARRPAPFPAGSMFWAKRDTIAWLKALRLGVSDFEPELGQLDGTMAHAVERVIGYAARLSGGDVIGIDQLLPPGG